MKARVQKWGNSLALRIPKSFAVEIGIGADSVVDLQLEGDKLVIRPIKKPRRTLEELLKGVTDDNIHREVDWGPPVGKEVW